MSAANTTGTRMKAGKAASTLRPKRVASELVKLLTLRSVWIAALATPVWCILMTVLTMPATRRAILEHDPALAPDVTPETVGLDVIAMAVISITVIGVIAGSSEYTSHQLKTSLLAVPNRSRLLLGKVTALLVLVVGMSMTIIPLTGVLIQVKLGSIGVLGDGIPGSLAWRWVGLGALWTATALMGFALGLWLRQTLIPMLVMIVVPQATFFLVKLVPFGQYTPFAAATQLSNDTIIASIRPDAVLSPPVAALTLAAWTLGLLTIALIQFHKRDVQT